MTHPYTRLFFLPVAPDADNDVTEGYEAGDVVHVTGGGVYSCRDASEGAAVWEQESTPDASTTVKGKVELATEDDAVNPSPSSTLALTPGSIANVLTGWIKLYAIATHVAYVSADAPTFVMNVHEFNAEAMTVGDKIWVQQTTNKYFIVTAIGTPSGGFTPITMYGGTNYVLTSATITVGYFSHAKSPFGFPTDPSLWTVSYSNTTDAATAPPTADVVCNPGSLSFSAPIGKWYVYSHISVAIISNL